MCVTGHWKRAQITTGAGPAAPVPSRAMKRFPPFPPFFEHRCQVLWLAALLALGVASSGHAAEPRPNGSAIETARELMGAWQVEKARPVIERLMAARPQSVDALDLAALLAYYEGAYPKALAAVEKALAIDAEDDQRQALRLLLQRTHDVTRHFKRYESRHFLLHLHEENDGILAEPALEALEQAHREVERALGYRPRSKVRVEIAPDVQSFNAITTLTLRDIEETGAIGLCKFNKVMIISPRVMAHGYRWLDSLTHEYIHLAIVNLTRNKAPIWLHEGIARYYETVWRKPVQGPRPDYLTPANETLLAKAIEEQEFVSFEDMEPSLIRLDTPEQVQLAYAEAASAVDYILQVKGPSGMRDVLSHVKRRSTAEAIEAVMGAPLDGFEADWRRFIQGQGLAAVQGSRLRSYKVAEDGDTQPAVALNEIQSEIARNRTHLGDRLRQRGRLRAAGAEYRRALRAGPNSTVILNRLGETLIHSRRYDEALPHLEKARYLDPDQVHTYYLMGRLHHEASDDTRARDALLEALQINPFHPGVYHVLSGVYEATGDDEGARKTRQIMRKLRG